MALFPSQMRRHMIIRRIVAHVYENLEGINKRKQEVIVQMTDS